mgnify:CR=1 FL=1
MKSRSVSGSRLAAEARMFQAVASSPRTTGSIGIFARAHEAVPGAAHLRALEGVAARRLRDEHQRGLAAAALRCFAEEQSHCHGGDCFAKSARNDR